MTHEKQGLARRFVGGIAEFGRGVKEVSQNTDSGVNTTGRQFGRIAGKSVRALKNVAQTMEREMAKPTPQPGKTRARVQADYDPLPTRPRRKRGQRRDGEIHVHIHLDDNGGIASVEEEDEDKARESEIDRQARAIWD